ncbi:MAG: DNA repair protein RecO [Planctomycetota bacterium]
MPLERAEGLILRLHDFSESSRVVTLYTREFGKMRALAKGGKRLRSPFESALDLLTHARIVLVRKTGGALHLLTEAVQATRFGGLRDNLEGIHGGFLVAELLGDWTEENDPHPRLLDEALATLARLSAGTLSGEAARAAVARFESVLLWELGYRPELERCVGCTRKALAGPLAFGFGHGGILCPVCRRDQRGWRELSDKAWKAALELTRQAAGEESGDGPLAACDGDTRRQVARWLGEYLGWIRGRRPRLMGWQET